MNYKSMVIATIAAGMLATTGCAARNNAATAPETLTNSAYTATQNGYGFGHNNRNNNQMGTYDRTGRLATRVNAPAAPRTVVAPAVRSAGRMPNALTTNANGVIPGGHIATNTNAIGTHRGIGTNAVVDQNSIAPFGDGLANHIGNRGGNTLRNTNNAIVDNTAVRTDMAARGLTTTANRAVAGTTANRAAANTNTGAVKHATANTTTKHATANAAVQHNVPLKTTARATTANTTAANTATANKTTANKTTANRTAAAANTTTANRATTANTAAAKTATHNDRNTSWTMGQNRGAVVTTRTAAANTATGNMAARNTAARTAGTTAARNTAARNTNARAGHNDRNTSWTTGGNTIYTHNANVAGGNAAARGLTTSAHNAATGRVGERVLVGTDTAGRTAAPRHRVTAGHRVATPAVLRPGTAHGTVTNTLHTGAVTRTATGM